RGRHIGLSAAPGRDDRRFRCLADAAQRTTRSITALVGMAMLCILLRIAPGPMWAVLSLTSCAGNGQLTLCQQTLDGADHLGCEARVKRTSGRAGKPGVNSTHDPVSADVER